LAAVSLIGEGFSKDKRIIPDTLKVLEDNKIKFYGLTSTSFRISILVRKDLLEKAVRVCHDYWII
jgi:aspartokinase